jgi:UPF0271 protein
MTGKRAIDLNADLGEGGPHDAAMIALVSSANIACAGHAGNESTMRDAVFECLAHGVAIGAHPGYEDPECFGRREQVMKHAEVACMIDRQIQRLLALAGDRVAHVKLHGALYHQADRDASLAASVTEAIARLLPGSIFFTPSGGELAKAGFDAGLQVVVEGFADRRYTRSGFLMSRDKPDAILSDINEAVEQAMDIASMQRVRTVDGSYFPLPAKTICVHGDNQSCLKTLQSVRDALILAGFVIQNPSQSYPWA